MLKPARFKAMQALAYICIMCLFAGISAAIFAVSTPVETKMIKVDLNLDGSIESFYLTSNSVFLTDFARGLTKQVPLKGPARNIRVADADLDGLMDLIVETAHAEDQIISNQALNELMEPATTKIDNAHFYEIYNTGNEVDNIWDTVIGDFDNDGRKDILVPTQTPYRALAVYESTGVDDSFTRVFETPYGATSGAFTKMAVGDTDGDGYQELISGRAGTLGTILLFENVGDNNYEQRTINISHPGPTPIKVLVADTDEDGKKEIIIGYGDVNGGHVYIHEHSGRIGQNVYQLIYEYHTVSYLCYLAVGDSDNDGLQEIILGLGGLGATEPYIRRLEYNPFDSHSNPENYIHTMVASGTGEPGLMAVPHVADVDGDNDNELIFGGAGGGGAGGGAVYIFDSPSNNTYQLTYLSNGIDGNVLEVATGPLEGSDYPVIVSGSYGGELSMWTYTNCSICHGGDKYKNILSPAIFASSDIRGLCVGYMDPGTRVDVVVGAHNRMHIYEQAPPEEISQLIGTHK